MTRLAKNSSALSKLGLALALFGGLMLGVSGIARAGDQGSDQSGETDNSPSSAAYLTGYYLRTTASATDDVITLINGNGEAPAENQTPTMISPDDFVDVCANLYVFDPGQDEIGCCSAHITAGGMARLPVNEIVSAISARSPIRVVPGTGTVKVISTVDTKSFGGSLGPCSAKNASDDFLISDSDTAGTTFGTEDSVHGTITHTNAVTGLSAAQFTNEVPLVKTEEGAEDLDQIGAKCVADIGPCCSAAGAAAAGCISN